MFSFAKRTQIILIVMIYAEKILINLNHSKNLRSFSILPDQTNAICENV